MNIVGVGIRSYGAGGVSSLEPVVGQEAPMAWAKGERILFSYTTF